MTFVFRCPRGHKVEVPEDRAEATQGTACGKCYGPLLVCAVHT